MALLYRLFAKAVPIISIWEFKTSTHLKSEAVAVIGTKSRKSEDGA